MARIAAFSPPEATVGEAGVARVVLQKTASKSPPDEVRTFSAFR
jgi:hypothetical protein